jgi:hypothetical protein
MANILLKLNSPTTGKPKTRRQIMKLQYWNDKHVFVVVKDGVAWQREKDLSNPPNITACSCCISKEMREKLKRMGIRVGEQYFESPPVIPPTEEEWREVKSATEEVVAEEKRKEDERKERAEENIKERRLWVANELISKLRFADAKVFCDTVGIDFQSLIIAI